jgi:hypothetical protein
MTIFIAFLLLISYSALRSSGYRSCIMAMSGVSSGAISNVAALDSGTEGASSDDT